MYGIVSGILLTQTHYSTYIDSAMVRNDGTWDALWELGELMSVGIFTVVQKVAVFGLVLSTVLLGIMMVTSKSGTAIEKLKTDTGRILIVSVALSAITTIVTSAISIGTGFVGPTF